MRSRRSIGVLVVLLVASACVGVATPSPTVAPPATFRAPSSDAFGQAINEVTGDFEPAGSELDSMWRAIFEHSHVDGQSAYTPPAGVAPYLPDEPPPIKCVRRTWKGNAFYCPSDSWIVYDETFLRGFDSAAGPFAPSAILSHEWGHHIQSLIGTAEYDLQDELQADCFAGMYLAYRERPSGGGLVNTEYAETQAALQAMFNLANENYSDATWFQAREHGSPIQRMLAYGTGLMPLDHGMPWCYGYRDYTKDDVSAIGPQYRLINFPGRNELPVDNGLVITPETRTGDDSSTIAIGWLSALPLAGQGATVEQWTEIAKSWVPQGSTLIMPGTDLVEAGAAGLATGYMALYLPPPGAAAPRSGLLAVITPESRDSGLLIDISRPNAGPPTDEVTMSPETEAYLAEVTVSVYQVLTRLCGPDQSGVVTQPNYSTSCADDV